MNYDTFKTSTISSIQKYFGNEITVSLSPIIKNNSKQLDGLMIQDSSINITPTIYLNYYYEDYLAGKSFGAILDDIIASYWDNLPDESMDLSFFTEFDRVKYKIIYKLIHRQKNLSLLEDIPHFHFLDLAVVFCCYLPDTPNGNGSILIHNNHMDYWKITSETLYDLAVKNTPILLPYELKSMEDVLKSMCQTESAPSLDTDFASGTPSMYVLSNTEKLYGASAMLYPDVISGFANFIDSDLCILPSSIHEVLLLPIEERSHGCELDCIVRDVNASQVLEEDILSDHAYYFDRTAGLITQ